MQLSTNKADLICHVKHGCCDIIGCKQFFINVFWLLSNKLVEHIYLSASMCRNFSF